MKLDKIAVSVLELSKTKIILYSKQIKGVRVKYGSI